MAETDAQIRLRAYVAEVTHAVGLVAVGVERSEFEHVRDLLDEIRGWAARADDAVVVVIAEKAAKG